MGIHDILASSGEWLHGHGPQSHIVISTRVRLARNLRNFPFPGWAKKNDRVAVLDCAKPAVESLPEMQDSHSVFSQDLSALEKQVLVERHLISREHAAKGIGSAVILNKKQTLSIMVNEEDHLRMQAIRSGLQLKSAYKLIDKVDTELADRLDFAFHARYGFLTACPTNVGTGMRASAMMHLPALVLSEQINQVIQAINKVGLAVRGLYGEGTEALGNLFQISNQTTLGEDESAILNRLNTVIEQLIQNEQNARASLLAKKPVTLQDNIGRAFGILRHAHSMASKEALNLLSYLKLGVDLAFIPEEHRRVIDELFIETQPAHLQRSTQQKLQANERDTLRALIIRKRITAMPEPHFAIAKGKANPEGEA